MLLRRSVGAIGHEADHGARMDTVYRTQRHFYDLTRKYYLLGRDRLIAGLDARPAMRVLEIGCGTGRNLIAVARMWPGTTLAGLDISAAMLESAQSAVAKAGLDSRIMLAQGDASNFVDAKPFGDRLFDRIFLSYTISMIPAWELALEEAVAMLAPGGSLHIVDFGQQERLPAPFRNMLFAWLNQFHVRPRADLPAVAQELAERHDLTCAFTPLWRGYAWSVVLNRR